MLILSRRAGESIDIDGHIKIRVVCVKGNRVQVGIEAPQDIQILRSELNAWHSIDGAWESEEKSTTNTKELALSGNDA